MEVYWVQEVTGADFQGMEENSVSWLGSSDLLRIHLLILTIEDNWHLPCPCSPLSVAKLVWGNLSIIYVKSLLHFSWMYTCRHFAIFPQSFASSHQSWPETAADHFWKLGRQRSVCPMVYDDYLLGFKVRSPDFFLCVSRIKSKYGNGNLKKPQSLQWQMKILACELKLFEKQKFNLMINANTL